MKEWKWRHLTETGCPVCSIPIQISQEPFSTRADGLKVFRCGFCSNIYVNPRPSDTDLQRYYTASVKHQMGGGYLARLENTIAAGHYKSIGTLPPPPYENAALLDVGCAGGYAMQCARSLGWSVTGVELSEPLASIARSRYGLDVISGTPDDVGRVLRKSSRRFECISMFDLIEHVADIPGFLSYYTEFLTPSGILHLDTPNYPAWVQSRSPEAECLHQNFTNILEHLSYLSIDSIRSLSKKLQFDVLSWGTYGHPWREAPSQQTVKRRIREVLEQLPHFDTLYWRARRASLSAARHFHIEDECGASLYVTLSRGLGT